ncbi:MAG: aminopeptidase P N-terminal domain-containing protein [Sulfurimonas sp.]|nr:aminopeptidase P N-terminal domain-containing protein [Sulfurimonas sp.]
MSVIKEEEYKKRRDKVAKRMSKNSVAIIFSATYKVRSNDTNYPFRQNSNFYYLTGFKEDNSILVLIKKNKKYKSILFINKKNKKEEMWNGKRLGVLKAKKRFLIDEIHISDKFQKKVSKYLEFKKNLYFDFKLDNSQTKLFEKIAKKINIHKNIALIIEKMRLIKSDSEIKLIKKAIDITKKAHHRLMKLDKIGKNEYELLSNIEHTFKSHGAYNDAYTSIVASGNSANTLHYIDNNKPLVNGELILIDAGCEYEYYASDITRTIAVNKQLSKAQRDIYELVLSVEKTIINMVKPNVKRSELHKKSEELLVKGMIRLGILKGNYKKIIKKQIHKKYYPHGIGHWLGLDVHDECPYKDENGAEIALKEGMVLTIEPGIYIDKYDENVPKKYRGIGIRIEDDILVTKDGNKNLSSAIKKEVIDLQS